MAYHVGELQAAIWRTEEAMELQTACVASTLDVELKVIAARNLATLEDLLLLQQGMLELLMHSNEVLPVLVPASCADALREHTDISKA